MKRTTWFVTGASKGLGLALVKQLLAEGYKVAATSRNTEALTAAVGEGHADFLPLAMDLLDEGNVQKAISATVEHFGSLDVVVNNAGYGLIGGIEELTDAETRSNFDVNVFGSLNVLRAALPYLREQKKQCIDNFLRHTLFKISLQIMPEQVAGFDLTEDENGIILLAAFHP